MDTQRFILFAALAFVMVLIMQSWQRYQMEINPPPAPVAVNAQSDTGQVAGSTGSGVPTTNGTASVPGANDGVPQAPVAAVAPSTAVPVASNATQGQVVTVKTDLIEAEIDTAGGTITKVRLLQHPVALKEPDNPFVLLENSLEHVHIAQSGLTGQGYAFPTHNTLFSVEQTDYILADGDDSVEVRLNWQSPDQVSYTKIYRFQRDSYNVAVEFEVNNHSATEWVGHFYGQLQQTDAGTSNMGGILSGQMPSYTGGAYYTPEAQYNKISFSDIQDEPLKTTSESGWVAMLQHYFVAAWLPGEGDKFQLFSSASKAVNPLYKVGYLGLTPTTIASGQQGRVGGELYVGSKERQRLEGQEVDGLALTVDFGWLTIIAEPLFWVLSKIHSVVGNWGWSIILVTMLIKLIFLPLSAASYKSMAKMKKLTPRLKTLKERYGDDKQKYQQAMMEMYKTEKVNPAGGCLPILVQIPVFIALYWVLLESVELRQAPWAFWINDLSSKDPYYVLPLIMGGSMLLQQFLNPAPMDPMQQKIMMAMPVVFTVFFLSFPAGLVLYWVVNNCLSILQQWLIQRRYT